MAGKQSVVAAGSDCDFHPVVVCGAGAAGLAAALSAARAGSSVFLVERGSGLGGTVTNVLIHTLGGFFDAEGELLNDGLAAEVVHRLKQADRSVRMRRIGRVCVLQVAPSTYGRVVNEWVSACARIHALCRARITAVRCEGPRVVEMELLQDGRHRRIRPEAVIDATGCGSVVQLIDPNLVELDSRRAAGGLIATLTGVVPGSLDFPKGAGVIRRLREATELGQLPSACRHVWLDVGTSVDEVYLKLFVPLASEERVSSRKPALSRVIESVAKLLRTIPGFEQAQVRRIGALGIRDGGRIRGEYRLQVDDVRAGRSFPDAASRCCWPIEFWDPDEGLLLEHLPEGTHYDIPLRALTLRGFENVWGAGKCLSADRLAHSSARVVGSCWGMGDAVGRAAAAVAAGAKHESDAFAL